MGVKHFKDWMQESYPENCVKERIKLVDIMWHALLVGELLVVTKFSAKAFISKGGRD